MKNGFKVYLDGDYGTQFQFDFNELDNKKIMDYDYGMTAFLDNDKTVDLSLLAGHDDYFPCLTDVKVRPFQGSEAFIAAFVIAYDYWGKYWDLSVKILLLVE